jgi:hypothetical protein
MPFARFMLAQMQLLNPAITVDANRFHSLSSGPVIGLNEAILRFTVSRAMGLRSEGVPKLALRLALLGHRRCAAPFLRA